MSAELHQQLIEISGLRVRPGEPMAAHVPLRVGGAAELWAVAEHADALRDCIRAARRNKVRWRLHWPLGQVVRDGHRRAHHARARLRGSSASRRISASARRRHGRRSPVGEGWWAELSRPGTPAGCSAMESRTIHGMCMGVRWLTGAGSADRSSPVSVPRPPRPSRSRSTWHRALIFDGVDGPPPRPGRLFADPVAGRVRPPSPSSGTPMSSAPGSGPGA